MKQQYLHSTPLPAALTEKGVTLLSSITLNGADIVAFVSHPDFMRTYFSQSLYNSDPSLIFAQKALGGFEWEDLDAPLENTMRSFFRVEYFESFLYERAGNIQVLTFGKQTQDFSVSHWLMRHKKLLHAFLSI